MRLIIFLNTIETMESAPCPKCGARIGEECFDGTASRDRNHKDRWRVATRQQHELIRAALAAYDDAVQR
jgi:hypothetical protein